MICSSRRVLTLNLNYIIAHVFVGVHSVRVNWPYMVSNLVFPLSLLFVVGILSQGKFLDYALVGGLISIVAMNGITAIAYLGSLKLDFRYQDLIMTTKTSKMDYMFAHLISEFVWVIPSMILYFLLDIHFGILTTYTFGMTLLIAALVSIATYSIAFLITSMMRHIRYTWAISVVISIFAITIPPTFYPYTYLPQNVLNILLIVPTTPAVVLEQGIFGLGAVQWSMLLILIVETVVYFLIAKYFTRWREN
jgi:ABC-2 type transport system permease protein